jgi:hypothetical protein
VEEKASERVRRLGFFGAPCRKQEGHSAWRAPEEGQPLVLPIEVPLLKFVIRLAEARAESQMYPAKAVPELPEADAQGRFRCRSRTSTTARRGPPRIDEM